MPKLTDEQVVEARRICHIDTNVHCTDCPLYEEYYETGGCVDELDRQTDDLINRLKADNERLQTENSILSQKRFNIFERIEFTGKLKKQFKTEAYKEFAERLEDKLSECHTVSDGEYCGFDTGEVYKAIKETLKEMVGEL